jgi:hypothetical protein
MMFGYQRLLQNSRNCKRREQGGIAIVNKSIFVGSESKVHVLDYKGHKMKKITGITGKSHYIHTCADNVTAIWVPGMTAISQGS